ncbi:MAG: galactitol-1-phosphate 5-dehydrogenase [Tepidisphaeraceae bacterium]
MKALLLVDKKRFEFTEFPVPEIGPDDLLVRVKACGICGSDVHGYDGSTGRRIPPIVMGHEAAGMIEQVGSGVTAFAAGDRITFDSTVYCGKCAFCRAGRINLCDNRRVLGVSCADYRRHGCFAEYVTVPSYIAYRLPDGLSFEHAAMVEAVSIALHAVNRAKPALGDSVVVVGAGMIGQLTVQALRAAGCGTLIAIDLDDTRLQKANRFGADHVLNAAAPDLGKTIAGLTGGAGARSVFEAVGSAPSLQTAIAAAAKGATVTLVGNISPQVPMPLQAIVTRELTLLGSCASCGEYPACLELMSRGKIDVQSLLSAVAPLEQGPQWFTRLHAQEPGLMKVILAP